MRIWHNTLIVTEIRRHEHAYSTQCSGAGRVDNDIVVSEHALLLVSAIRSWVSKLYLLQRNSIRLVALLSEYGILSLLGILRGFSSMQIRT